MNTNTRFIQIPTTILDNDEFLKLSTPLQMMVIMLCRHCWYSKPGHKQILSGTLRKEGEGPYSVVELNTLIAPNIKIRQFKDNIKQLIAVGFLNTAKINGHEYFVVPQMQTPEPLPYIPNYKKELHYQTALSILNDPYFEGVKFEEIGKMEDKYGDEVVCNAIMFAYDDRNNYKKAVKDINRLLWYICSKRTYLKYY